jgi:hypothetical protein
LSFDKALIIKNFAKNYVFGKHSLKQLSEKYQISVNNIQRHFSQLRSVGIIYAEKWVVILMDTTSWGRNFGVVVFKDTGTGRILWQKFIFRKETLVDYTQGVDWLVFHGFQIDGIDEYFKASFFC